MGRAPHTVLAPKTRLTPPLTVVHVTPDWALATAYWDKNRALLIRWNGDPSKPLGNPVSHGNPTWFVLPSDTHWAMLGLADPAKRLKAAQWLDGPPLP